MSQWFLYITDSLVSAAIGAGIVFFVKSGKLAGLEADAIRYYQSEIDKIRAEKVKIQLELAFLKKKFNLN